MTFGTFERRTLAEAMRRFFTEFVYWNLKQPDAELMVARTMTEANAYLDAVAAFVPRLKKHIPALRVWVSNGFRKGS